MTATELTAKSFRFSLWLMEQMVSDLTPAEWLHRPVPGANCAAWIVGHLILSTRSMHAGLGGTPAAQLPDGFEQRFNQKEGGPELKEYGDTSILWPLLKQETEALIGYLENLSQDLLAQARPKPHPMFKTNGDLAALAPVHLANHAGQISTIRRSLGRKPVI